MIIDFIENTDSDYLEDKMVRLTNFSTFEVSSLIKTLQNLKTGNLKSIILNDLNYIIQGDIILEFKLSTIDKGLYQSEEKHFICEINYESFDEMIKYIEPFLNVTSGFQFLVEPKNNIELLLSCDGFW